jgi:transcriptional regulator GlxA family with amidase domain
MKSAVCSAASPRSQPHTLLLYVSADCSALDISTIATVFAHANRLACQRLYQVLLAGPASHVQSNEGICWVTQPADSLPPACTVVLPGNPLSGPQGAALQQELSARLAAARRWAAVDDGVLALAELGLLTQRRVSVRQGRARALAQRAPGALGDERVLFACDGALWSCPGGAPVADMCLAMVEADFGRKLANRIAHELLLFGRRGSDQPQVSTILQVQNRGGRDRELAALVQWINQNLDARFDVPALAARVAMSERNFHRRFKAYTGYSPGDYVNQVRVEHARQLMLAEMSLKEAASRSGFSSPSMASRALRRAPAGEGEVQDRSGGQAADLE